MFAPHFLSSVTVAVILSVSLFLKSFASFIMVVPFAWVATTAIIGISSISFGIISPEISQAVKSEYETFISPTGSFATVFSGNWGVKQCASRFHSLHFHAFRH